ncbi:hypothetical protein [Leisingera sp. JC1]|nr:hypothetical protein [Leisingera sp. JC1]
MTTLTLNKSGRIETGLHNATVIFTNDARIKGRLEYAAVNCLPCFQSSA